MNSSEVTAGFLSATNRWQPRRVLFPLCRLGGRLTCRHLKHRSLPPAHRRLPNTTQIPPRCPLISILKSMGGSLITTPLINKHREGPHRILTWLQETLQLSLQFHSAAQAGSRPDYTGTESSFLIYPYVWESEQISLHQTWRKTSGDAKSSISATLIYP